MAKIKKETRELVFKKYNECCAYCGVGLTYSTFHVDHIQPKFRGYTDESLRGYGVERGKDSIDNYNPSCKSCNSSKSTFTLEQWRNEISLKRMRIRRDSSTFRILERFELVKLKETEVKFYFERYEEGV